MISLEDALKLCAVFDAADGGCSACVQEMICVANKANLGVYWVYEDGMVKVDGEA